MCLKLLPIVSSSKSSVSCRARSSDSTRYCYFFQIPSSSLVPKIIQWLLTSSSSSSPPFYISFNNACYKAVFTQEMTTNPFSHLVFLYVGCPFLPGIYRYLLFDKTGPTVRLPDSYVTTRWYNVEAVFILLK